MRLSADTVLVARSSHEWHLKPYVLYLQTANGTRSSELSTPDLSHLSARCFDAEMLPLRLLRFQGGSAHSDRSLAFTVFAGLLKGRCHLC